MALKLLGSLDLSGGSLGIGTTDPVTYLDVRADPLVYTPATARFGTTSPLYIINHYDAVIGFNSYYYFGIWKAGSSGYAGRLGFQPSNGDMYFKTSTLTAPAADDQVSDTTPLYIKNNGYVGIGDFTYITPEAVLHVYNPNGGTDVPFILKSHNANTWMTIGSLSGNWAMGVTEDNKWMVQDRAWNSGNPTRMTIDESGNVGIGTTSPNEKLHVGGNLHVHDEEGDTDASILLTAGTSNVTTTVLASNGTSYLNGGNVGIGTTTPGYKLDVNGTLRSSNITIADYIIHEGDTNTYIGFGLADRFNVVTNGVSRLSVEDSGVFVNSTLWVTEKIGHTGDSNTYMTFLNDTIFWHTNGSERMRINSSGNIGIGMNNPSEKLTVNGNFIAYGTVTASGDITAFSDSRIKENIKTLPNALESVKRMRGVTYNKIGEEKQSIGVIAQEVQSILPELVSENSDGMLSVAYGNITGVLIEAIKEQQKQIEELKAQLDGLTK